MVFSNLIIFYLFLKNLFINKVQLKKDKIKNLNQLLQKISNFIKYSDKLYLKLVLLTKFNGLYKKYFNLMKRKLKLLI